MAAAPLLVSRVCEFGSRNATFSQTTAAGDLLEALCQDVRDLTA
jgi:hypothetical protein